MTAPVSPSAPVAWRYAHKNAPTAWSVTDYDVGNDWPNLIVEPLYASPAPSMVGLREKVAVPYEVEDDHLPLTAALKLLSGATDMAVYASEGSANVAYVARQCLALLAREGV